MSEEPLTAPPGRAALGVSRQNVQRVANDLVALGLIDLMVNPDHRSSPLLTPTPAGKDALVRVTTRAEEWHCSLFADLSDEEIRATHASLRRLLGASGERRG
ncbi:MarR family winged helix-turn-helix transcriptional regulator [Streptomyces cinereoruber]|uniref:MarR family winged helix-turn-helix transcriptional regulator n=1 Tax=Streptomyces cinereoruber TaxID=67260 RepID=UPI003BF57270